MQLVLYNLTNQFICCRSNGVDLLLVPSGSLSTTVSSTRPLTTLSFLLRPSGANGFSIKLPIIPAALSQAIPVPDGCPWRIYLTRNKKKYYRLSIIPRRDLASFLSKMPDTLPLSSLCLPGTHNSMAFYGWPISQCQEFSTPLAVQLQSGIRVLDIRLSIIDSRLIAYHGILSQRTPFQDILSTVHAFLTSPSASRETIIMSIKQEDFAKNSHLDFSRLVHDEIFNGPGGVEMWYLSNRVPSLGEARGKVVLFSRFGGNGEGWERGWEGLGIHPLVWPDSKKSGFSWNCKDTLVQTHDWYAIPSFLAISEKFSLASQLLLPPHNNPPMPTLALTFLSASSFPLALPPIVAKGFGWPKWGLGMEGVNSRFVQFLLDLLGQQTTPSPHREKVDDHPDDGPCIRGWALLDYYAEPALDIVPLLVECNYRGRRKGVRMYLSGVHSSI